MSPPSRFSREAAERSLTDADIEAIVASLEERLTTALYKNVGKGVWALFQKAVIGVIITVAAYGYFRGLK